MTPSPGNETPTWQALYKLGGIAALLAVFVFRRNLGAELMAFKGFGLFAVPETMPVRAAEWFALLQSNRFIGLALLNVFDLVEYALVGLIFLAVCAALWQLSRSAVLIATVCGLSGIAIYFASNQACAMLSLSTQYARATTDAQRDMFLAAGEALLAINNPGALHEGTGIYASLFLVLLAGLMISIVMLRSNVFSKPTAVTGILANGFMLAYFVVLPFAPELVVLPFVFSAPFRVTWYFLIARKLFQLGKADSKWADMSQEIKTINLWDKHFLLRGSSGVNCYLVKTDAGYFLIDTGFHARRADLVQELERAGCKPGNLKLIIITHGDLDHTGNCAYLRAKYGAKIATHRNEAEAVESGNMALSRKSGPGLIARTFLSFFSLLSKSDRFKPDLYVEDGHDLSEYGFEAQVLFIPGHSKGSIGILTANRDLFCGDLLWNMGKPESQPNTDDSADLTASIEKLKGLQIRTVYPGHGRPFLMEQLITSN